MAGNYAQLLDIINNPTQHGLPAWDNNTKQIEGETIQQYLLSIINSLTVGYQFMGVASTDTSGGTPDQNVFYLAGAGTYNGFGSNPITIDAGYIGIISWNGAWSSDTIKTADVVSVTQNKSTGKTEIVVGEDSCFVGSATDVVAIQKMIGQSYIPLTMQEGKYYDAQGNEVSNDGSIYSGIVDVSALNTKGIIVAYKASDVSDSGRFCLFYDDDDNVIVITTEHHYFDSQNGIAYLLAESDVNISYFKLSFRKQNIVYGAYSYGTINGKNLNELNAINGIKWIDSEWININGGIVTNAGTRFRSDFIPCAGNAVINYIAETNNQLVAGISFWDVNRQFISGVANNATLNDVATVTSPANTCYCILSGKGDNGNTKDVCTLSSNKSGTINVLNKIKSSIPNSMIQPLINVTTKDYFKESIYVAKDSVTSVGETYTIAQGGYMFFNMPVTNIVEDFIKVVFTLVSGDLSKSKCRIWNGLTSAGEIYKEFESIGNNCFVCEVPINTFTQTLNYFQVRFDAREISGNLVIKDICVFADGYFVNVGDNTTDSVYIASNGNDNNSGSSSSPFATLNKALSIGARHIYIKGGTYQQTLNLQDSANNVTIESADYDKRVIFINPNSLISDSETAVSGYTKVYSCTCNKAISQWLFQDGVADVSTLITDAERNPYQRGYTYRTEDTKIVQCSSETLNDALVEIEGADDYRWYLDNGTLYFSRPQTITPTNPLRYGDSNFISGNHRTKHLTMRGIEVKYMSFNVTQLSGCLIEDCKASNVRAAGAFVYDRSLSIKFVRCEAVRAYYDGTGDGFNGHSVNAGDVFSKQTTCMLIDCWSHDNNDDGYSDHERSEIEIWGGLFEYNGKAGITPSYGSHCSCYNVISRRNYNGFYYVGEVAPEEGGKYGQMLCIGCVAENNGGAGQSGIGFGVTSSGNKATVISCKSINNSIGYYAGTNTLLEMIDCGSLGNTDIKYGDGSFTIKNTTTVS